MYSIGCSRYQSYRTERTNEKSERRERIANWILTDSGGWFGSLLMSSDTAGLPAALGTPVLTSIHEQAHQSPPAPFYTFSCGTFFFFPIKHANTDTQGSMPKHPKTCTHQLTHRQMHICTQTYTFLHCHWSLAFTFVQGPLAARMERQGELQRQQRDGERERE